MGQYSLSRKDLVDSDSLTEAPAKSTLRSSLSEIAADLAESEVITSDSLKGYEPTPILTYVFALGNSVIVRIHRVSECRYLPFGPCYIDLWHRAGAQQLKVLFNIFLNGIGRVPRNPFGANPSIQLTTQKAHRYSKVYSDNLKVLVTVRDLLGNLKPYRRSFKLDTSPKFGVIKEGLMHLIPVQSSCGEICFQDFCVDDSVEIQLMILFDE